MRLELLVLSLIITLPLGAQERANPTPRQSYNRAETLLAEGHLFTAPELAFLEQLRARMVDTGDQRMVADLDLLRLAATTVALDREAGDRRLKTLADDANFWAEEEEFQKGRGFWRGVRDLGITTFTLSTMTTLLLAAVNDRNDALSKGTAPNPMQWAMVGTSTTMLLSLFPLLWGEARQ